MALADITNVSSAGASGITSSGGGADAIDTTANLTALARSEGKIYYSTDENILYTDNGTTLDSVAGGGGGVTLVDVATNEVVEYRTVSAGEATAKALTLTNSPYNAAKTKVMIVEGPSAQYTVDFTVAAALLTWNGLALDGVLASGDKLRITYRVTTL